MADKPFTSVTLCSKPLPGKGLGCNTFFNSGVTTCYKALQTVTGDEIMLKVSELLAAVSPRTQAEKELVDIKDLSLDELVVRVRELAAELDAIPLDFSQQWSVEQLKGELMALEFQRLLVESWKSPVPLIPWSHHPDLDQQSDEAWWLVHIPATSDEYFWVSRGQLISHFSTNY